MNKIIFSALILLTLSFILAFNSVNTPCHKNQNRILVVKDSIKRTNENNSFYLKYKLPYFLFEEKSIQDKINKQICENLIKNGFFNYIEDENSCLSFKEKFERFKKNLISSNNYDHPSGEIEIDFNTNYNENQFCSIRVYITSILNSGYQYDFFNINLDFKNMKFITSDDVFTQNSSDMLTLINKRIKETIIEDLNSHKEVETPEKELLINERLFDHSPKQFFFKKEIHQNTDGIVVMVNKDWGARLDNTLEVSFSFEELKPFLSKKFKNRIFN